MNVPDNQVLNVSFKYIDNWNTNTSPYGHTRENFDLNFMCRYCKNEQTDKITDKVILNQYERFFKQSSKWHMIHCFCCNSTFFSYELPKKGIIELIEDLKLDEDKDVNDILVELSTYEQKLIDAKMDSSRYIRENICKSDEDWQQIQRLLRLDSGLSAFYICQENNNEFNIDEYTLDSDFDLIYKKDIE